MLQDLVRISNTLAVGNALECILATDRTFTQSTRAELVAALREFPVLGSPDV